VSAEGTAVAAAGPAEPSRRLAPRARWVWRLNWLGGCLAGLIAGRIASSAAGDPWDTLLWVVPLAALVAGTPLVPELRYRRWRWEVRAHEIDIRRGTFRVRRTLIPMARVQHVESDRGLLEQALGLATVAVHTAAGGHTIPLLTQDDAGRLRARIADLARMEGRPEAELDGSPPPAAAPPAEGEPAGSLPPPAAAPPPRAPEESGAERG
jgi:membrane protein YdbS with pleckstrin-like domain